jgi:hypothetical protein
MKKWMDRGSGGNIKEKIILFKHVSTEQGENISKELQFFFKLVKELWALGGVTTEQLNAD